VSFLSKITKPILKVAAPIAQSYVQTAFPVAAPFINAAIGGASRSTGAQPMSIMPMGNGTSAPGMPGGGIIQTGGGTGAWGTVTKGATNVAKGIGNMLISGGNVALSRAGRVLGVLRNGKLFGNAKVLKLAKQIGMDAAAAALGCGVADLAAMIINAQESAARKSRRGRGISGRDVRTTRRTLTKIRSIEHSLAGSCRPRTRTTRARSAPAQFVRQG
jgi:hypothetical protein